MDKGLGGLDGGLGGLDEGLGGLDGGLDGGIDKGFGGLGGSLHRNAWEILYLICIFICKPWIPGGQPARRIRVVFYLNPGGLGLFRV